MNPTPEQQRYLAEADAAKAAAAYKSWLQELMNAARELTRGVPIPPADHFGFMSVQFHAKQLHHSHALQLLDDHADCALVARSMLEGSALLKWVELVPARALRWRMFSAIVDWRLARSAELQGYALSAGETQEVQERVMNLDDDYLSEAARKEKRAGRELPADPWVTRWYQPQLRQIFESAGRLGDYIGPYHMMSEWHHWSPGGIAPRTSADGQELSFRPHSRMMQVFALGAAFTSLAEDSLIVGRHFHRELERVVTVIENCACDPVIKSPWGSPAP